MNCRGKIITLDEPKIMGILNLTPDSFYAGSRITEQNLIEKAGRMIADGADFLDIGGYSSRPGASDISEKEELRRILPAIELLADCFPGIPLSADTFRSRVAAEAVKAGASIINDISGGEADENMFRTVAGLQVPYVLMHMRGNPRTMKNLTGYKDLMGELIYYFSEKIYLLSDLGVNDIILDPGFGFAKTISQNFDLLRNLNDLNILKLPVMVGLSRKSMIYKTLDTGPEDALNGTTVLNTIALLNNAKILRVHDVKQARETVKLVTFIDTKKSDGIKH